MSEAMRTALETVVGAIGDWSMPRPANGMIPAGEDHPLCVAARIGRAALALPASPLIEDEGLELRELLAKAGGLPWAYRPEKFDDWGTIRTAPDAEGMSWPICQARLPYSAEEALAEHRRNGTDPWEDTARLIVAAVNFVARNIDRIAALSPGQEKR